jgi:hypothetical protein
MYASIMKPPAAEPPIHYEGHTPGVERVASVTHPIKPKVAEIAGPVQLPHEQVGGCKPLGQGEFRHFADRLGVPTWWSALPFVGVVMSEARDLAFFFNGVEMTDESVENVLAEFPIPVKGGTTRRGGKVWTVVEVRKTEAPSTAGNPVYCIFLSLAMSPTVARTRFRPDIEIPVTIYRQHRDISESRHSGQFTKSH